jgi:hypothetical protein
VVRKQPDSNADNRKMWVGEGKKEVQSGGFLVLVLKKRDRRKRKIGLNEAHLVKRYVVENIRITVLY